MTKLDLRASLKHLYAPSAKHAELVDVPCFNFTMLEGEILAGETPATSSPFDEAIGALYSISFTLKFMSKQRRENPIDYPVMPLEGLWSTESGGFDTERKEPWQWTLMIVQPDHIDEEMYRDALTQLARKKPSPALDKLQLKRFCEGLSIQMLHVGPYADESRTIESLHSFARQNGYRLTGKHHEIYLGDPRRAAPERLKTILRHPVEKT